MLGTALVAAAASAYAPSRRGGRAARSEEQRAGPGCSPPLTAPAPRAPTWKPPLTKRSTQSPNSRISDTTASAPLSPSRSLCRDLGGAAAAWCGTVGAGAAWVVTVGGGRAKPTAAGARKRGSEEQKRVRRSFRDAGTEAAGGRGQGGPPAPVPVPLFMLVPVAPARPPRRQRWRPDRPRQHRPLGSLRQPAGQLVSQPSCYSRC